MEIAHHFSMLPSLIITLSRHMSSFICLSGIQIGKLMMEQMKMPFCSPSIKKMSRRKLKNTTETYVLLGVYIVFQLAVLGSLLSIHSDNPSPSQLQSCGHGNSWVPLHIYSGLHMSKLLHMSYACLVDCFFSFYWFPCACVGFPCTCWRGHSSFWLVYLWANACACVEPSSNLTNLVCCFVKH